MKKNKMMRIASVLLVAVLMSTCAISGTFAKYVTSAEGGDSARVAKWGVEITAATDMFSDSYKDAHTTYTANESTGEITVQAAAADTNIVAPGTNGSLVGFTVTGTPEVDVNVTYVATLTLTGWKVTGDWDDNDVTPDEEVEYCPIVITVNGVTYGTNDTSATNKSATIADLQTAVKAAIEAKAATYHTNTNLSAVNDDVVVSWSWAFEGNDDAKDTALGDLSTAPTIELNIQTTITQVD